MTAPQHSSAWLAELQPYLERHAYRRIVARPGWVWGDRADGTSEPLDVAWTQDLHDAALESLGDGAEGLADGTVVTTVAGRLVLWMPPPTTARLELLVTAGWMSTLSARLIAAALRLGRNVLVLGPWETATEWMAAALSEGQRPAILAGQPTPVPTPWPRVSTLDEARCLGADRLGVWDGDMGRVIDVMGHGVSVLAWLDARRLEQALLRIEASIERRFGRVTGPLHVLSGLDLIVRLQGGGEPRVVEVMELVVGDDGYRPVPLFATGVAPVPSALSPVMLPSFIEALPDVGHALLRDELQQACMGDIPAPPPPPPAVPTVVAPGPATHAPEASVGRSHEPVVEPVAELATLPPLDAGSPPPGWELDQLEPSAVIRGSEKMSPEDASMAATYGLAPPPRPNGIEPPTGAKGSAPGEDFADILRRAERE